MLLTIHYRNYVIKLLINEYITTFSEHDIEIGSLFTYLVVNNLYSIKYLVIKFKIIILILIFHCKIYFLFISLQYNNKQNVVYLLFHTMNYGFIILLKIKC